MSLQQPNIKQKFVALLKRFKVSDEVRPLTPKVNGELNSPGFTQHPWCTLCIATESQDSGINIPAPRGLPGRALRNRVAKKDLSERRRERGYAHNVGQHSYARPLVMPKPLVCDTGTDLADAAAVVT